jgi:hypothetical protein
MEFKTCTVLGLMVVSGAAHAWQPLAYPIRSQSPYQQSVDTATCYAEANKTKVDIRRESQIPPRTPPASKGASTGVPSRPPLPQSTFSAAPTNVGLPASAPDAGASAPMATAAVPGGASHARGASAPMAGSAPMAARPASAPMAGSAPITGSAALAAAAPSSASGAPGSADALLLASQADAASGTKLPPLPEPEPPMVRYWAAYSACMQARGYGTTQ